MMFWLDDVVTNAGVVRGVLSVVLLVTMIWIVERNAGDFGPFLPALKRWWARRRRRSEDPPLESVDRYWRQKSVTQAEYLELLDRDERYKASEFTQPNDAMHICKRCHHVLGDREVSRVRHLIVDDLFDHPQVLGEDLRVIPLCRHCMPSGPGTRVPVTVIGPPIGLPVPQANPGIPVRLDRRLLTRPAFQALAELFPIEAADPPSRELVTHAYQYPGAPPMPIGGGPRDCDVCGRPARDPVHTLKEGTA